MDKGSFKECNRRLNKLWGKEKVYGAIGFLTAYSKRSLNLTFGGLLGVADVDLDKMRKVLTLLISFNIKKEFQWTGQLLKEKIFCASHEKLHYKPEM